MEKSKVIEKLFLYIATYAYLLLPLLYVTFRPKAREAIILAAYGIVFFFLMFFVYDVPPKLRSLYNTLFTFFEYSVFASVFYLNINNTKFRKIIIFLSCAFFIFQVVHYFFMENAVMDSIPIGIESILIFIYITLFFSDVLKNAKQEFIYNHYCFWVSVALLIYLGGSFFMNILATSLTVSELVKYWYFTYICDIVKTLLFCIVLIMLSKRVDVKPSRAKIPYLDLI